MSISKHPLYKRWLSMRARCSKPRHESYPRYGAKGIKVCARWNESFAAFLEDMPGFSEGLVIDRIDNNRGYEPGNCRWVSVTESNRNRRNVLSVEFRGSKRSVLEISELTGLSVNTIQERIKFGRSLEVPNRLKLSKDDAQKIRELRASGVSVKELCAKFKVTNQLIYRIISREVHR